MNRNPTDGGRLVPPRRARPLLAAASSVLVLVCGAVFTTAYLRAAHEQSVLALSQDVAQGSVVLSADLTVARVGISGALAPLPASAVGSVLGRRAAVALERGSLLVSGDLVSSGGPPSGQDVVGVALKVGQLPASGVSPGTLVDVVLTGPPGAPVTDASSLGASVVVSSALVVDEVPPSSGSDTTIVSVLVPDSSAATVAAASASGQCALIAVGATQ